MTLRTSPRTVQDVDKYWQRLAYEKQSIDECADEKIQRCGAIQDCAYLIVVDLKTNLIAAISENFSQFLNKPIANYLDQELKDLPFELNPVDREAIEKLGPQSVDIQFSSEKKLIGKALVANQMLYLEFEQDIQPDSNLTSIFDQITDLLTSSQGNRNLEDLLDKVTDSVKRATGFDRVMFYRFEPNLDGYIIAESKAEKLESFLGLRYPASDIPAQARKLFYESESRSLENVEALPIPLFTAQGISPIDIDMGHSYFRASSPFHIEYLRNMGVTATLSIPIKISGGLWGLIACHHYSGPKLLNQETRKICELFGCFISSWVQSYLNQSRLILKNKILELSQNILDSMTSGQSTTQAFQDNGKDLLKAVNADCMAVKIGSEFIKYGDCPPDEVVESVVEKLHDLRENDIWYTDCAPDHGIVDHPTVIGVLAAPLSLNFDDYIIWFRPAAEQSITWAGKPKHLSNPVPANRLSPRGSFELWRETITHKSLQWREEETEAAQYILYSFLRDIFKKANELAKANDELQKLARAKDEFIGMISHELRTPLNVMLGWIEIAKDFSGITPEMHEAIEIIDRNAKVQINLINDLLDISRIVSGKLRVKIKDNVSLKKIVSEVIDDLQPTADMKEIYLHSEIQEDFVTSGDPERLRQIVWNLISNAIKFTNRSGEVIVQISKLASTYQLSVSDNGIGIDQDTLPNIFNRFSQAKGSSTRNSGLGLGLSIVKALVELHGGQISAQSLGRNKGSTFTVILPILATHRQEEILKESEAKFENEKSDSLRGLNILVAEDQSDGAMALKIILERSGAEVTLESDGKSAFAQYASNTKKKFDLIVSDIGMPRWDGLTLIKKVRQLEKERRISRVPAIALTAYATPKDRIACLEAGFQSHLPKPVEKQELIAVIHSLNLGVSNDSQ